MTLTILSAFCMPHVPKIVDMKNFNSNFFLRHKVLFMCLWIWRGDSFVAAAPNICVRARWIFGNALLLIASVILKKVCVCGRPTG